jgi:hypothetical protein
MTAAMATALQRNHLIDKRFKVKEECSQHHGTRYVTVIAIRAEAMMDMKEAP